MDPKDDAYYEKLENVTKGHWFDDWIKIFGENYKGEFDDVITEEEKQKIKEKNDLVVAAVLPPPPPVPEVKPPPPTGIAKPPPKSFAEIGIPPADTNEWNEWASQVEDLISGEITTNDLVIWNEFLRKNPPTLNQQIRLDKITKDLKKKILLKGSPPAGVPPPPAGVPPPPTEEAAVQVSDEEIEKFERLKKTFPKEQLLGMQTAALQISPADFEILYNKKEGEKPIIMKQIKKTIFSPKKKAPAVTAALPADDKTKLVFPDLPKNESDWENWKSKVEALITDEITDDVKKEINIFLAKSIISDKAAIQGQFVLKVINPLKKKLRDMKPSAVAVPPPAESGVVPPQPEGTPEAESGVVPPPPEGTPPDKAAVPHVFPTTTTSFSSIRQFPLSNDVFTIGQWETEVKNLIEDKIITNNDLLNWQSYMNLIEKGLTVKTPGYTDTRKKIFTEITTEINDKLKNLQPKADLSIITEIPKSDDKTEWDDWKSSVQKSFTGKKIEKANKDEWLEFVKKNHSELDKNSIDDTYSVISEKYLNEITEFINKELREIQIKKLTPKDDTRPMKMALAKRSVVEKNEIKLNERGFSDDYKALGKLKEELRNLNELNEKLLKEKKQIELQNSTYNEADEKQKEEDINKQIEILNGDLEKLNEEFKLLNERANNKEWKEKNQKINQKQIDINVQNTMLSDTKNKQNDATEFLTKKATIENKIQKSKNNIDAKKIEIRDKIRKLLENYISNSNDLDDETDEESDIDNDDDTDGTKKRKKTKPSTSRRKNKRKTPATKLRRSPRLKKQ
jgi:hypothetical protein